MRTNLLTVNEFEAAARIIRVGGLVGIPTETVYGLGANGLDPLAVRSIFQAKGRPQDNPLILHIPDPSWLERYCEDIPEAAWRLAKRFWPGPLTMILRRKPIVPDVVTAGLDTVGMRCPAHAVCRAVIQAAEVPVAAPSGNLSGKPSPTTARHMLDDMDGRINAILDGGDCQVGVESTIIDLTCRPPRLLRPGGVFLTQQVGAENDRELVKLLLPQEPPLPFPKQYLAIARETAEACGLTVLEGQEAFQPIRFWDVGALVWFARIIEWEFPGFSVEACRDRLYAAQAMLERDGVLQGMTHRYLLIARKAEP